MRTLPLITDLQSPAMRPQALGGALQGGGLTPESAQPNLHAGHAGWLPHGAACHPDWEHVSGCKQAGGHRADAPGETALPG